MDLAFYQDVCKRLQQSAHFEKNASLVAKTTHDYALFQHVKEAGVGTWLRSATKHPLGKGLMAGAGAAVPLTAGGAYLIGRGGDEAQNWNKDLRNKALQAALGIGVAGAGLYGAHGLMGLAKQSSVNKDILLEKLSTTGFLDTIFEDQEKNASTLTLTDAGELRKLNAEHGIDILRELLNQ